MQTENWRVVDLGAVAARAYRLPIVLATKSGTGLPMLALQWHLWKLHGATRGALCSAGAGSARVAGERGVAKRGVVDAVDAEEAAAVVAAANRPVVDSLRAGVRNMHPRVT